MVQHPELVVLSNRLNTTREDLEKVIPLLTRYGICILLGKAEHTPTSKIYPVLLCGHQNGLTTHGWWKNMSPHLPVASHERLGRASTLSPLLTSQPLFLPGGSAPGARQTQSFVGNRGSTDKGRTTHLPLRTCSCIAEHYGELRDSP